MARKDLNKSNRISERSSLLENSQDAGSVSLSHDEPYVISLSHKCMNTNS